MKTRFIKNGLLALLTLISVASCNQTVDKYCTVTFRQENADDIIIEVKQGGDLKYVPSPYAKTGYTVSWDKNDFTNITEDIIVNAISSANTYTITYSAAGFAIDGQVVELVYDSICTSLDMSLTKNDAYFNGWKYNDIIYTNESVWNVANNVTLVADWRAKEEVTVTFIDSDGTTITKSVFKGQDLEDIPTPTSKTGYTVTWDISDFTNITEDMTVRTIEEAKSYTVNLNPNGGTINQTSITVTYDQEYTLEKPVHPENSFISWTYNNQKVSLSGTWNIDTDEEIINLVAEYGDSDWTGYY